MVGALSICIYIILSIFIYYIAKYQYLRAEYYRIILEKEKKKLSYIAIIIFAVLLTMYNIFCTISVNEMGYDRKNYEIEFGGYRSPKSVGLQLIFTFVKILGGDIKTVFYLTTFICVLLTLLAYRKSKMTNYRILLLFLLSEWVFYTFTALKQCYACAFATLFFVYIIEDNSKKGIFISLLLAILASAFHTAGFILFPIFFIFLSKKMPAWKTSILIWTIVVGICLLDPILIFVARLTKTILPILSDKILLYMESGLFVEGASVFSFLKWFPFYYITIMGIYYKKKMIKVIPGYGKYLIASVIASGLAIFSIKAYWFYRFLPLFYMPVYILFDAINAQLQIQINKQFNKIVVYGGSAVVLYRWLALIYINYGTF